MSILEWYGTIVAYGPVLVVAMGAVAIMVYVFVGSLRQASGSLLEASYPPVEPAAGTRRTRERVVFGKGPRMTWVKVGADHTYLHVTVVGSLVSRGGFSVPLSDVAAEPDRFPLMIMAPDVIRLTFARDHTMPMLVWPRVFEKLSAASRGQLQVTAGRSHYAGAGE